MKDSIILGTGNSRYLKSVENFKTLYPTYDDFVTALVAGTLPFDFNGINHDGFQQVGDGLNAENLLKASTAALYELPDTAVPDDVFVLLQTLVSNAQSTADIKSIISAGTYTGTGNYGSSNKCSLTFDFTPKIVFVQCKLRSSSAYNSEQDRHLRLLYGSDWAIGVEGNNYWVNKVEWEDKKVSWYCETSNASAMTQFNNSGVIFSYVAIG